MLRKATIVAAVAFIGVVTVVPGSAYANVDATMVCSNTVGVSEDLAPEASAVGDFAYNNVFLLGGEMNQTLVAGVLNTAITWVYQASNTDSIVIGVRNDSSSTAHIEGWLVERWAC